MNKNEHLRGKIITVLGNIDADDLGFTQVHEHLLVDMSVYFAEPKYNSEKAIAYQPLCLENLRWVKYHLRYHLDNAKMLDEQVAIQELTPFMRAGGNSIVDQTSIGLGRDPKALVRISRATGINIVMGTGHYVTMPHDPAMEKKSVEQLAEEIIRDISLGADDTGIRAGIIGEVGCSWPLRDNEKKALRAAANAQKQTGLAITVHPSRNEDGPREAIEVLREEGADLKKVVVCHMDRCGYLLKTRLNLLQTGCFVEYDLFGSEGWYPPEAALADNTLPNILNDVGRIREIADLIDRGYLNQILISHDICYKIQQARWGGPGYAHIIENVIPLMRVYGYTDEQINALTQMNPRRLLNIE